MDKEQLRMVLDALQSLGAEGKDAFVWWIVMDKTIGPLAWLLTFVGILFVVRWIIGAIGTYSMMEELREAVGLDEHSSGKNDAETVKRALEIIRSSKAG